MISAINGCNTSYVKVFLPNDLKMRFISPFLYYFSHLAFHSSIDLCHALSLSYWLQHWSDYIWCRVCVKMWSQGQQLLMQAENRSSVRSALFPEAFYLLVTVSVQDSLDPHLARWLFAFPNTAVTLLYLLTLLCNFFLTALYLSNDLTQQKWQYNLDI